MSWTLKCVVIVLAGATLIAAKTRQSSGGKTSLKNAIARLAKYPKKNTNIGSEPRAEQRSEIGQYPSGKYPFTSLKRSLMDGYDKDSRPVHNDSDIIVVEVDLTYRQVLDMDEKNQILTSLVWYRKHWQDVHLKWIPEEQNGLKELWLPAETVWKPDIILQEETGVKDFSPRLPFVKVNFDGHVEYQEPVTFTTSCSMNTMHFPFDVQHCNFTFSSWSHPGHKISLKAERTSQQMANDIEVFVNTGEWNLEFTDVTETRVNYSRLFAESNSEDIDWPEVVFTMTLRRNSSFYTQSLIFPSVLLTTVALFGFLLPASSGERVGLQITILLTFMVFLLTVCEMFPASNGPYLGYYYVICIFLLSVNLLMTVLVLKLHYHPPALVPQWLEVVVRAIGKCCMVDVSHLKEKTACGHTEKLCERRRSTRKSCLCNVMLTCLKESEPDNSGEETAAGLDSCEILDNACRRRSHEAGWHNKAAMGKRLPIKDATSAKRSCKCHYDSKKLTRIRTCQATAYCTKRTKVKNAHHCRRLQCSNDRCHENFADDDQIFIKTDSAWREWITSEVDKLLQTTRQLVKTVKDEENDWKKLALVLDKAFLRLYSAMLVLSHAIILATAFMTSSSIEPHSEH